MKRFRSTVLVLFSCLAWSAAVVAQGDAGSLTVALNERWGHHLVDDAGNSLYVYLADEAVDGSACVDTCVNNWPPVVASEFATAGEGVDDALMASIERADGEPQATYAGRPLYRFARDTQPGHVRGQGLGDAFYLVGVDGTPITEEAIVESGPVDEELLAALRTEGAEQYQRNCAVCHGGEGQGVVGPALDGMNNLGSTAFIASTIVYGRTFHGMPAFGDTLDDREIAAIATFVRTSWTNDFGLVDPEEVVDHR